MRIRQSLLVTVSVLIALQCGISQTNKRTKGEKSCWDTAMTQRELNECGGTELRKADAELNRVYAALLEKLKSDPVATDNLKASERAWIIFRDAQMKALHPHPDEEGSVRPMCWSLEMAELTLQRTEMLKNMLTPEKEGDVCNYGS